MRWIRDATAADADALGQVHVQAWRETYPGMLPDAVLAQLDPTVRATAGRTRIEGRSAVVKLAEQDDAIIEFASGGAQSDATLPYAGEITALYVLRRAQRQGVGRRLMAALARNLIAAGVPSAMLRVLEANAPARLFYESLGGRPIAQRERQHTGFTAVEIAYGWPDLLTLI